MYKIECRTHLVCRLAQNAFSYILCLIPNSLLKGGQPQRPCLVLIRSKVIISWERASFSLRSAPHVLAEIHSWGVILGELNIQLTEFSLKKKRKRNSQGEGSFNYKHLYFILHSPLQGLLVRHCLDVPMGRASGLHLQEPQLEQDSMKYDLPFRMLPMFCGLAPKEMVLVFPFAYWGYLGA